MRNGSICFLDSIPLRTLISYTPQNTFPDNLPESLIDSISVNWLSFIFPVAIYKADNDYCYFYLHTLFATGQSIWTPFFPSDNVNRLSLR